MLQNVGVRINSLLLQWKKSVRLILIGKKYRISLLFVESPDFFFHESPDFPLSGVGRSADKSSSLAKEFSTASVLSVRWMQKRGRETSEKIRPQLKETICTQVATRLAPRSREILPGKKGVARDLRKDNVHLGLSITMVETETPTVTADTRIYAVAK